MNQFDCGATAIGNVYRNPQYLQDLQNSLGLSAGSISKYCDSMQTVGGQFVLLNANNDPLRLAHLYRDFLIETPDVFLVDNKPELVQAILDYVENLILTGEGLTPKRASILNGILPAQYSQGYDRIHHKIEFPRDHHIKTNVSTGWYFLVGNVFSVNQRTKYGFEIIFWYYPIFPKDFLRSRSLPDDAFLVQSVTVALTVTASPTNNSYYCNATGLVMTNSGAAKHSLPEDKRVFFSVGNSSLLSDADDLSKLTVVARDVDIQTGAPIVMSLKLTATKPLFYEGNGKGCTPCIAGLGTLYYSYPRYSVEDVQLQYGTAAAMIAKDFDLKDSMFWLDHQWAYGFFAAAYPENLMVRSLSNFYTSNFSGWYWFMGHLNDGRDFTFSVSCDNHLDSLPSGDVLKTDKTEGKVISAVGTPSQLYTNGKLLAKNWISVKIGSIGSSVTVTAFVPTECIITIAGEDFVMKADYPTPISRNRQGAYVREGSVTIHSADTASGGSGPVIGHGFMEMTGWFVSQDDLDRSIYSELGGALQDNRPHIASLSRRNPYWSLKLQSFLFLAFLTVIIILLFVLLPLYIIYIIVSQKQPQAP